MDNQPPITICTTAPECSTKIKIEQNNKIFLLTLEYDNNNFNMNICEENNLSNISFYKKMILSEIKNIHQLFSGINSFDEFIEYIKAAHENKKLSIDLKEDKLIINILSEYLFKQHNIEIILLPKKLKLNDIITNLSQELSILKEKIKNLEEKQNINNEENFQNKINEIIDKQNNEINYLKEELKKIKEENNNLKEENTKINNKLEEYILTLGQKENIDCNSTILKNEEYDMIFSAIKTRIKKRIKKVLKLYQAKEDGGDPSIFHKKCDNILNTLTLIRSGGNRRFGGFTSEIWNHSEKGWKNDNNAFIFSLDKKKIYPYKNNGKAIYTKNVYGPCFGFGHDIGIVGDPIKGKNLKTFKSSSSYDYSENSALSEDKDYNGVYALDYEVFQIIFI